MGEGGGRREKGGRRKEMGEGEGRRKKEKNLKRKTKNHFPPQSKLEGVRSCGAALGQGRGIRAQSSLLPGNLKPKT